MTLSTALSGVPDHNVVITNQTVATPTTMMYWGINLPAEETIAGSSGGVRAMAFWYVDNLGSHRTLDIEFTPDVPTTGASNTWTMVIRDSASGGAIIGEYTLAFDATRAKGGALLSVSVVSGGAYDATSGDIALNVAGGKIDVNIGKIGDHSGLTQLSSNFAPTRITYDGSPDGQLETAEIDVLGHISASEFVGVTVLGNLVSQYGFALEYDGLSIDLAVTQNGSVTSGNPFGTIKADVSIAFTLQNAGSIFSSRSAVDVRASDQWADIYVLNSGTIMAGDDGLVLSGGSKGDIYFMNAGLISGGFGGIKFLESEAHLVNHGTITGVQYSVRGSNMADSIENFGFMAGALYLRSGSDHVMNQGTMGPVFLGYGADVFDGRGGGITGSVYGGAGDDTYIISSSDITLVENAGKGTDLVKSTVSYTLEKNIENLTLLGDEDTNGTGNGADNVIKGNSGDNILRGGTGEDIIWGRSGDDVLRGGSGRDSLIGGNGDDLLHAGYGTDILTGGGGEDLFVFSRAIHSANNANADVIADFELGVDRIDLTKLVVGKFDFLGTAGFTGTGPEIRATFNGADSIVRIDVDGDGVADMKIVLTGVSGLTDLDFLL